MQNRFHIADALHIDFLAKLNHSVANPQQSLAMAALILWIMQKKLRPFFITAVTFCLINDFTFQMQKNEEKMAFAYLIIAAGVEIIGSDQICTN